jgi:hypothetical protein
MVTNLVFVKIRKQFLLPEVMFCKALTKIRRRKRTIPVSNTNLFS